MIGLAQRRLLEHRASGETRDPLLGHEAQDGRRTERELGHAGHVQPRREAEQRLVERANALLVSDVEDEVSEHGRGSRYGDPASPPALGGSATGSVADSPPGATA